MTYKTYLAHCLSTFGHKCYLGSKSDISYLTRSLRDYIYLDKGFHKGVSEKIYETVKKNNGTIISLDEEGAVDFSDNSTLLGRYSPELFKHVDYVFFWGRHQKSIIKKQIPENSKNQITGHPRFELLKPKFHNIYDNEINRIKNIYKNFVLINTNMSFGNNIKGDSFVISNYGSRFKNITKIIKSDKDKLIAFKSLIKGISKLKKNIVIRPHPEEDISFYIDSFKDYSNINVAYDGSVIPWLLSCDLMIHPDCTTAIEYLFIGKNPISFLPENFDSELVTKLPLEASTCFSNELEILKYIDSNKNHNDLKNMNHPLIEDYFSFSKPSTKLISKEINAISLRKSPEILKPLNIKQKLYLILKSIRTSISINSAESKLIRNKLKGLSYASVIDFSSEFKNLDKKFEDIKISKINKTLFLFSNK